VFSYVVPIGFLYRSILLGSIRLVLVHVFTGLVLKYCDIYLLHTAIPVKIGSILLWCVLSPASTLAYLGSFSPAE
jgi:hypothetical protein